MDGTDALTRVRLLRIPRTHRMYSTATILAFGDDL